MGLKSPRMQPIVRSRVLPERILLKVNRTQQERPRCKHKISVEVLEDSASINAKWTRISKF
jgi:hypothetical protein